MPGPGDAVAVIVPNYNKERVLRACLDSVRAQTHRPVEVIVIDDASTDRSPQIAREFCEERDGVRCSLVELPGNGGAAAARNAGVAASEAPLLFFVDSDTVLAPDAIENALRALRDHPGYGMVQGIYDPEPLYDDGPVERYRVAVEHFMRRQATAPLFSCSLIPREIYLEAGGLDEEIPYGEDTEFGSRLTARHPLLVTPTVVCQADDVDRLLPLLKITFLRATVTVELARRAWRRRHGGPDQTWRAMMSPSRMSYFDQLAKLSTALLLVSLLAVPSALLLPGLPVPPPVLLVAPPLFATAALVCSHEFLRFAYRLRGARFAGFAAGMHLLFHSAFVLGTGAGLVWGVGRARSRWRRVAWRLLGVGFVAALVMAVGWVLVRQDWTVVATALERQDRGRLGLLLGGALLAAAAGMLPAVVAWRAVLVDLGPPVRTAHVVRIFFIFFLARYLPRGLGLVGTVAVARTGGVTLGRLVNAMILNLVVVAMTAFTVGTVAGLDRFGSQGWWLVLAPALTVVLLVRPQLVNQGARRLMRLFRRAEPTGSVSARGIRTAVAAQTVSWLVSGLHLWLLAIMMGAPVAGSLALCVGAYSLAVVVGMLAIVVPDGIGVRESILTGALVVVLPLPSALAVTLASRLVTTVADAVVGGPALLATEIAHRRAGRSNDAEPPPVRPRQPSPPVRVAADDDQVTT